MNSRRDFIKRTAGISIAATFGGILPGYSALSYRRIIGSNERIRVSVMGVNSRGFQLAGQFSGQKNCEVIHICDVDSRAIGKTIKNVYEIRGNKPTGFSDFRKSLESKEVDALVVAAPDHWHAPATLLGLKAGKHIYVEKPLSHNPYEGELLVQAQKKYEKVVQLGTQRRSWFNIIDAIEEVRSGAIGRPYYGRGWYANNRGTIGTGKVTAVPEWLNWDLWQGPAPREEFKNNFVHYNWHWFWNWGTGEALNNGTHFVDLLRWAMNVNFPVRISSNGGRYRYIDDWQTPDTQVVSMDFKEGVTISWEGRSCNASPEHNTPVGAIIYGEKGSMFLDAKNAYSIYDLEGKVLKEVRDESAFDTLNPSDPGGVAGRPHIQDFVRAIKTGEKPNSDVLNGYKSTLLVQLGNISQRVGRSLDINPDNGHILNDNEAQKLWSRKYEQGWEMKL